MADRLDSPADAMRSLHLPGQAGDGALDFGSLLRVADQLPVMIAFLDRHFAFRFANKPMTEWLRRDRAEILGRTFESVFGQAAWDSRRPLLEMALAGERKWFAAPFPHPDGHEAALQTDYVPWAGPDGTVHGVLCIVQDVTEQRAAERAIRESEARFRRIADQAPVLMWVTRLDGLRDFVNEAYADFVGLSRDEAQRYDWRQAIHPDDLDRVVALSVAGEASLKPFSLEARFRRADGNWRWLRSTSSPRFGVEGEHAGFIGAATDITLAKEAELELRRLVDERTGALAESEAQFRAIFDAVLEVLVLMRPDGTIIQVNRKREHWRHPQGEEAIGRKIWESPTLLNYPQHIPMIRAAVEQAAKGKRFSREVLMERDGVPAAHIDISVQPVPDEDGAIAYLLFEARDITDLKAAQEQLRQSQKMEALGQLTGGIAHDFNNLLTVVVGGLDLIAKRVEDPKLRTYAANALSAAERGAKLTGQLLAFSRVQRLEVRPTPVVPLIEAMRPLLRNVLGPGIQKKIALQSGPVAVLADPTQLELAVLNLAINARDAMPDGGTLTITTRVSRIDEDAELDPGDYLELAIGDTGEGMAPHVAARAFEPFFTTKDVGKGTGLGLSMVYGVARQSGGTARIASRPGEGTCVSLFFRIAEAPRPTEEKAQADRQPAASAGGARVLVVDDDPDVREFVADSLADLGYDVRTAADGKTGLAAFAERVPDVLILDYIMPGLSGADVARRVLKDRPGQPILFISGYSETDAIRQIAPDAPLLTKPFRADALDQAVGRLLGAPAAAGSAD